MKQLKLQGLLLTATILFSINTLTSQTAEEIIDGYLEVIGGVEAIQNVEGVIINASANQGGLELPIEIVSSKNRSSLTISIQGQELKDGVFDGEVLWSSGFPDFKPVKSDEEDVINFKNEIQEFPDVFVTYKDLGYTAEFDGTDDFEGTEVYKIKMTKTPYLIDGEENPNIDYYLFDMDNYVLLAVWSEMLEGPGKGAVIQQSFSDYQEVEGVYYPFSLTFGAKGQPGGQTFVVQSMEINPELDDSDFKFPEEESQE
jgi:hypothetical protein